MKRVCIIILCLLLSNLFIVACHMETSGKMDTSNKFVRGFTIDNITPLSDILKYSYKLTDLKAFFGEVSPNESLIYGIVKDRKNLSIDSVNEQFPIECIRHNNGIGYYSIYDVSDGGYFYVFWSLLYSPNNSLDTEIFPNDAKVYFTAYLSTFPKTSDFIQITADNSTAEDVARIDPAVELSFTLSSAICSYSLLDDGSILEIEYKHNDPINSRRDLIVKNMTIVSSASSSSCLAAIYQKDLP